MAIRRVIAHWSGAGPPGPSPFPAALAGYPAAPPPNVGTPPPSPVPPGVLLYRLWCELADQADIDAIAWSGPGWPGPPPPVPDQGYAAPAVGFRVFTVRAVAVTGSMGTDFEFTLHPPGGQPPITLSPPLYEQALAPALEGRGIWYVDVAFAPGAAGTTASGVHLGPPPVEEPYFAPYASAVEGILAIEFDGRPTTTTTTSTSTTSTTTTSTTTTTPPPQCYDVQLSFTTPCAPAGGTANLQFTATVTPLAGAPPYTGPFQWKIRRKTGAGMWQTVQQATQTGPNADQYAATLGPGDYVVEVAISTPNCPEGFVATAVVPFTILACDCPTFTGALTATVTTDPCAWTFSAAVLNPQNLTLTFDWDFGDGATATTATGSTSHTYTSSGTRTVTVTVRAAEQPACTDTLSTVIAVTCTPGSTTTTTTTTTSGTTSTTTSATTSASTTPGGGGCLCLLLLVLALVLIAAAAAALFAWACGGFGGLGLLLVGIGLAVVGAIVLALWALFCGAFDCATLLMLIDFLRVLTVALAILAGILALVGLGTCAIGALIVAGFFSALVSMLFSIGQFVGCVRTGP